jgi:branched-chain amino acid transport system substrate-binding protein
LKTAQQMGAEAAKQSGHATVAKLKSIPTEDDAFGKGRIRADGRGEFPAYLFQVKTEAESTGPWDLYKPIHTSPPSEVLHPLLDTCKFPTA